jgi:hypothetical protein
VTKRWAEPDSEQPDPGAEVTVESSANGASPDTAIGVAEPPGDESVVTTDESVAIADEAIEDAPPVAESTDEGSPSDAAEDLPSAAADEGSEFLSELVRAMRTTAGLERARIGDDIDRRRQDHIDKVQARKALEADRMRELAAEDTAAIQAWVEGETTRIELERERRETAVREDLELSLAEHGSKIDREIEGVEAAIATYRAEVEAFFDDLDGETDPVLIAKRAALRPVFPALYALVAATVVDDTGQTAGADDQEAGDGATGAGTYGEPRLKLVGVMDTEAAGEPVESWAMSPETSPEPLPVSALDGADQVEAAPEPAEPVTASNGSHHSSVGSLLESVPVLRPMSWLWRDSHEADRTNHEE